MAKEEETPEVPESSASPNQAEQKVEAEQPEITREARMWAMFCHLGGLAGLLMPVVGNIVAPLIDIGVGAWEDRGKATVSMEPPGE